jgi:hypothetical protein
MGIFVENSNTYEVEVLYVFDKEGEVSVITDEDAEYISKPEEEKLKVKDDYDSIITNSIPFNNQISSIMDYKKEDIRVLKFTFRKMNFSDSSVLLSGMGNSGGSISPTDIIDYNIKKLTMLFKIGYAHSEDGTKVTVTKSNLGSIAPALGNAVSLKMQ